MTRLGTDLSGYVLPERPWCNGLSVGLWCRPGFDSLDIQMIFIFSPFSCEPAILKVSCVSPLRKSDEEVAKKYLAVLPR